MARKVTRYAIPLAIFVLMVGLLGVGLTLDPRRVPSPLIDKPVPQFTLPNLHQPGVDFSPEQFKGKPWILNVWASWCVACRQEHEVLKQLARYDNVVLVGLNYKDQVDDAKQWLLRLGDPYTLSIVDADGKVGIDWGVYGVPETFVIDAGGVIRHKHIGPLTDADVNETVLPLLQRLAG